MKKEVVFSVMLACLVALGMVFMGCGGDSSGPPTGGSGIYTGTDRDGNSYQLLIGSDARAAVQGDNYKLIISKDGTTYTSTGTVTKISEDGTLELTPDGKTEKDVITVVVSGTTLDSVTGTVALSNGTTFTPRTFDKIYLRAHKWDNRLIDEEDNNNYGEDWFSGDSVFVGDFPTHGIIEFEQNHNAYSNDGSPGYKYTITISGKSDKKLEWLKVAFFGITAEDKWVWLADNNIYMKVNIPNDQFSVKAPLDIWSLDGKPANFYKFATYPKGIVMSVTNEFLMMDGTELNNLDSDKHRKNGTIGNVTNGQIMATISNFSIELKDENWTP